MIRNEYASPSICWNSSASFNYASLQPLTENWYTQWICYPIIQCNESIYDNESFTFFFPRLYRNNLIEIILISPTIFSVTLAILWKIGWNVELRARDQDNRGNNLQIDLTNTWGPRFFHVISILRKNLIFVKYKTTYVTVEPFPCEHLCNTDTSPIRTADNLLYLDQILLYSLH